MEITLVTAPHEGLAPKIRRALLAMARCIWTWQERASARHRLEGLDDHALADMGLTRGDVARETAKPFWMG